jgi:hypothetical protein
MGRFLVSLMLGFSFASPVMGCTMVNQPTPREELKLAAVVFRGTVLKSEQLAMHPEMRGRQRFRVTLRVSEYWKGNLGETVTLYDLAPGADCMGQGMRPDKEYLIFASEEGARDHRFDNIFWFGWTDVLPAGTPMLQPMGTLGGELSDAVVHSNMQHLGRGRKPRK